MPPKPPADGALAAALRACAARLPETTEGVACAGTALESRTAQVRKKAFLFLGPKEARLKLRESLPEALHLAAKDPARWRVGSLGWVAVTLAGGSPADREVLERWVGESWRLQAPQDLLEAVAPRGTRPDAPAPPRAPRARKAAAPAPRATAKKAARPKPARKPARRSRRRGR